MYFPPLNLRKRVGDMHQFIKLFVINFIIGVLYSVAYYVVINILRWEFLTAALTINTIGSLQGCLWYYLGQKKGKRFTWETSEGVVK